MTTTQQTEILTAALNLSHAVASLPDADYIPLIQSMRDKGFPLPATLSALRMLVRTATQAAPAPEFRNPITIPVTFTT